MDLMQETPSNSVLAALVAALRAGKTKLNDWSAVPGLLAEKGSMIHGKLGDLTIGDTAPNELQNWAEGNLPVEFGPGTKIPRFKRDAQGSRGAAALEAAGFLPIGTIMKAAPLAAKGAMMIPIAHGVEANASRATDLARRARAAAVDLDKGATASDIWDMHKVSEVPRGPAGKLPAEHGRFMHEIPDQGASFSPYALGTENDKIDAISKIDPKMLFSQAPADVARVKQFLAADMPLGLPGASKMGDVLRHDALYESQPWMKNLDFKGGEFNPGNFGSYQAPAFPSKNFEGLVELSTATGFEKPGSISTPMGTTLHELQHAVQQKHEMPGGGSPSRVVDPRKDDMYLAETITSLRDNNAPPELVDQVLRALRSGSSYGSYRNLLGEQQARATQKRYFSKSPGTLLNSYEDLSMGIDPDVMKQLFQMKNDPSKLVSDPDLRSLALIQRLRSYRAP